MLLRTIKSSAAWCVLVPRDVIAKGHKHVYGPNLLNGEIKYTKLENVSRSMSALS